MPTQIVFGRLGYNTGNGTVGPLIDNDGNAVSQNLNPTSTSAQTTISAPSIGGKLGMRVSTDVPVYVAVGASPTASATSGYFVPAGGTDYIVVTAGDKAAVIVAGGSGSTGQPTVMPQRLRDNLGRLKVSLHQNVYEADFEYGLQPLRWEQYTARAGTIVHQPGAGGVRMRVTTASGDVTIRQSRPYHRYQPGKTMYMATAANLGATQANQVQRIGFLDDSNGIFFEQSGAGTGTNPYGMFVVYRSDVSGTPTDTRIALDTWNGDAAVIASMDWTRIQMLWIEYAWYGAGALRWGCFINGEPIILHQVGIGNLASQGTPWSRTGNLPVRYEQRNTGATALQNDMVHYGVSVMIEGRSDAQRGFTYSYGMARQTPRRTVSANVVQYPVLSIRPRPMGTIEFSNTNSAATAGSTTTLTASGATWTTDQWKGRALYLPSGPLPTVSTGTVAGQVGTVTFTAPHGLRVGDYLTFAGFTPSGWNISLAVTSVTSTTVVTVTFVGTAPGNVTVVGTVVTPLTARITGNTSTVLTFGDVVLGAALPAALASGVAYQIGLINRGQLLPQQLLVSSSALCVVELIASTPSSPVVLTAPTFGSLVGQGSNNSFAERDVVATALAGGEVVYAFTAPAGGSGLLQIDLSNFFPLYNTVRGNLPDLLTVAVTTQAATPADVGAHLICQEAMS